MAVALALGNTQAERKAQAECKTDTDPNGKREPRELTGTVRNIRQENHNGKGNILYHNTHLLPLR